MITNLTEEDIKHVLAISDRSIGENFQTYDSVKAYINHSHKAAKVFTVNHNIAGFIKGEVTEKITLRKSLLITDPTIKEELSGDGYVGYFETICVDNQYRGTKIGTQLLVELIQALRGIDNLEAIYTTIWKSPDGIANAKKMAENVGFRLVTEIPNYWHSDSIASNYRCPKCGAPPCRCTMMFYKLKTLWTL